MSEPPISAEVLPFAEVIELKKRLDKVEATVSSIDVAQLKLIIELASAMGLWRCNQCKLNINNVCTGWRLSQELANNITSIAGSNAIVHQDNLYRFNIAKLPFIGVLCPIFASKT